MRIGRRTRLAELPYLQAEEDRLLYVAATRARETLVVSRSIERLRTPAWGVLNDFLARAHELADSAIRRASRPSNRLIAEMNAQTAAADRADGGTVAREPTILDDNLGHGRGATHCIA